jgi:predicted nucleic acid-binding protein
MIIVSDTTPLISLMKIGHLDLVNQMFGDVCVPKAVFAELVSNNKFPEECRQIKECTYIKKIEVNDEKSVELLRKSTGLDLGESESIILSNTIDVSYLLMDELRGRRVAKQMGIPVMGTIGLLMIAYKENLLTKDEILDSINVLRNSGRHISEMLYRQLIESIENEQL